MPGVDVAVLAYPAVFPSAVAATIDAIAVANVVAERFDGANRLPRFKARVLAARSGWMNVTPLMRLRAAAMGARVPDVLFVPPALNNRIRPLFESAEALAAEQRMIARAHAAGAIIASQCAGVILTAASGVLDGRRATTSWWLGEVFAARYPKVRLALDRMIVEDRRVWTAGPASAQFDLYVRLVQQYMGDDLASMCAQLWAAEPGREQQGAYARHAATTDAMVDPLVNKAIDHAERHLGAELSLAELADAVATSPRTLIRRFRASLGDTPLGYVQKMRVDRAKRMLATSSLSLERIVERSGYSDISSFRKVFRAHTGLTPADYRSRFQLRRVAGR